MKAKRDFFNRDVVLVAQDLLGKKLVRETPLGIIKGLIVETEAYSDANDLASHARFGITKRNEPMFGQPGILYVYLNYGIFNLTNIVCNNKGTPSAVLIRSAEIIERKSIAIKHLSASKFVKVNDKLATGPGKLSMAFNITRQDNLLDLTTTSKLYIEIPNKTVPLFDIIKRPRIGVDYADHCRDLPWRFYIGGNRYVSRK